jgi:hypothetical protein
MATEKKETRNPNTIESELAQFTGTTQYFRHWLGGLIYTDGVQHLAERAGAYWLIDAIASWQPQASRAKEEFQHWELNVHDDRSADLTARRDSGEPTIVHQKIEYTDFPLKTITLYLEGNVLLLPTEH